MSDGSYSTRPQLGAVQLTDYLFFLRREHSNSLLRNLLAALYVTTSLLVVVFTNYQMYAQKFCIVQHSEAPLQWYPWFRRLRPKYPFTSPLTHKDGIDMLCGMLLTI